MEFETPPVPTSAAEVTTEWMRAALSRSLPTCSISKVALEQIGEGYGLSSLLYRCVLEGDHHPASVILKIWSTEGAAGTNEVYFYRDLAPRMGSHVPISYYGGIDSQRSRGVLVLEDLGAIIQGDCLEELPLRQASLLAESLAEIHATWWTRPELSEAEWLPSVHVVVRGNDWFQARKGILLQRFADRLAPPDLALVDDILRVEVRANERLAGSPSTLLHADLHLDNIVFRKATGQPVVLDWARAARGPAVLDLAELVFTIARPGDQGRLLNSYMERFLQLRNLGDEERQLHSRLGGALLRKFISSTFGMARWIPTSYREKQMIDVSFNRICRAMQAWRSEDPDLFAF